MKRFLLTTVFSLASFFALAQAPVYLFDNFTDGTIMLKNRSVVKTKFNIDTFHDNLQYMDGDDVMIMSDLSNVSSIVIGGRSFIVSGKDIYEVVPVEGGSSLFVRWHQKRIPLGKKGAYDQVVHGSVQSVDADYFSNAGVKNKKPEQEMRLITENTYAIYCGDRLRTFKDRRSLLKLFPAHKSEIESFITSNSLLFTSPSDVIRIVAYAESL
ncbi:MAG: hypothetical protein IK143_00210 [Bacteroidales bacterium]|nr:hypothetical protein [Bacteroidales bacterium]